MTAQTLKSGRAAILYDDALLSHADTALFTAAHWAERGALRQAAAGRGRTLIVAAPGGEWVLRHYHRGGLPARFNRDLYLWTGLEQSRPWREWRLLAELYKEGLPVPQPVAAQVTPLGPFYRGDLITCRIPDSRSLAERFAADGAERLPWAELGRCLHRFHVAGVFHADLNAHNVLLDDAGGIYLIDFDRGVRRAPATAWQEANLGRLSRSLHKLAPSDAALGRGWTAFLDAYRAGG
jgi:3-deoxy-D-manno-octulosonic acid kinase